MRRSLIIYGPMRCGKTCNKQQLAEHFGFDQVIDDVEPLRIPPRARFDHLLLTNHDLSAVNSIDGTPCIPYATAAKFAGIAPATLTTEA